MRTKATFLILGIVVLFNILIPKNTFAQAPVTDVGAGIQREALLGPGKGNFIRNQLVQCVDQSPEWRH